MNANLYFWCALLGLLGVIVQTLIKISTLQKQSKLANHPFNISDYFSNDWAIIVLNIVAVVVALIAFDELTTYYPVVLKVVKWFFFFLGYTGSSLLNFFLSKTQKIVDNVIDTKSNIADNKN
jgi:hypothetical protein